MQPLCENDYRVIHDPNQQIFQDESNYFFCLVLFGLLNN